MDSSVATLNARSRLSKVDVRHGVLIPLRDGVELSATVYTPADKQPLGPAIFTLTPYIAQTYHDRAAAFAAEGFPFVAVDVRGRGNSGGEFLPFVHEGDDGCDIVSWLARQPYCDGRVAMWGGSYGGYAQWMTATKFPEGLATIIPVASPYLGVDLPGRGNMPLPYMIQWLTLVWGRASQDKLFWNNDEYWGRKFADAHIEGSAFASLDEHFGFASRTFQQWAAHPDQGPFWEAYNPAPDSYRHLKVPVLSITGAYDGDQPGALRHYRNHISSGSDAPHFLVIGPWDHAGTRSPVRNFCGLEMGPNSLLDIQQLHLDWYHWTMCGGDRPAFLRDNVAYYVAGSDQWRYATSLEDATARFITNYLTSSSNPVDLFHSGTLAPQPDNSGPDHYVYDPTDTSLAELEISMDPESRFDQRMVVASASKHLVYHTSAFDRALEVTGFFRFEAWISIDQPDTDFSVAVYEIRVDGTSVLLTTDAVRARYRNSLHHAELVDTLEPLLYRFEGFSFVSREIAAASRLRLVFGPKSSIYAQKNYNSGGIVSQETIADSRPVVVTIFHDRSKPACLHVPVGHQPVGAN
jgi:putative CocE/NonD family hydrolase